MEELNTFALFLTCCPSKFLLLFQIFLETTKRFASTCFLRHVIPLVLKYDIKPFFDLFFQLKINKLLE
jgi:hypothetical protein